MLFEKAANGLRREDFRVRRLKGRGNGGESGGAVAFGDRLILSGL